MIFITFCCCKIYGYFHVSACVRFFNFYLQFSSCFKSGIANYTEFPLWLLVPNNQKSLSKNPGGRVGKCILPSMSFHLLLEATPSPTVHPPVLLVLSESTVGGVCKACCFYVPLPLTFKPNGLWMIS